MKRITLALLAVAALASGCQNSSTPPVAKKNPDAVKLEFFVMSQCPFGVQVVNAVKDVVDKMGPDLDFTMDFIGNVDEKGEMTSMHGPDEVTGDIVQLCAMKHAPANYLDMILCQNKDNGYREVAKNWEKCSTEAKLPVEKIRSCLNGPEGKELLKASFERAKAKRATGSPTIYLAGQAYSGRRGTIDFMRSVCGAHKGATKPQACQAIPEPPKVNVTILSDKRCPDCNPERFVNMLKFRLANPEIKMVDYADADGAELYAKTNNANLPLVLFDATLDADKEASQMFARHLKPVGAPAEAAAGQPAAPAQYRSLEVGASWSPVCMNEGGCALPQCKDTLACRKETPNKLEVFVMSQCPYGVKALNAMEEVLKNFDKKIDFSVNYIASGTAKDGFTSLHGQPEVDENIRELCAIKHYGKNNKYMDYILCRNKDIRGTNWESCAVNGIDAKVMKKCVEGDEGKKLHEENIKLAGSLGIQASPTWLANGKYKFSGIDAETIKRNLCQYNKGLANCEKTLSAAPAGGALPPGGGCK